MLVYVGRLSSKSKLFDYHGPLRRPFPKLLPRRDHLSLPPFFFPSKSSLSTNNFHRHLKSRLRKRQGNKLTGFLSRESGEELTKGRETLQAGQIWRKRRRRSGIIFLIRLCREFRFTVEGLARYCAPVHDSPIPSRGGNNGRIKIRKRTRQSLIHRAELTHARTNTRAHTSTPVARDAGFRGFPHPAW